MIGVVKRLNGDKGFGFIRPEGQPPSAGKDDFFFHRSGARDFDSLREGDRVEFEQEDSPKGPRAGNVSRI